MDPEPQVSLIAAHGLLSGELWIALIAAGAALLGTLVGQLGPVVQDWLSARRARRALLRERFEELAALGEQLAQVTVLQIRAPDSEDRESLDRRLTISSRLVVLCRLYFQDLEGLAIECTVASDRWIKFRDVKFENGIEHALAVEKAHGEFADAVRKASSKYT